MLSHRPGFSMYNQRLFRGNDTADQDLLVERTSRVPISCVFIAANKRRRKTLSKRCAKMETTPRPSSIAASNIQKSQQCKHVGSTRPKTLAAPHKFWFPFRKLSFQRMEVQNIVFSELAAVSLLAMFVFHLRGNYVNVCIVVSLGAHNIEYVGVNTIKLSRGICQTTN